ncbi:ABC transporter permease [Cryobacterium sp. Hh7]|uniref:ABC transporter permease n=1 Tax=Cryobacterium sp. Hh7 TaxID=1259159 RepID=UPI00141AAC53|nr:ABC transporter permease [Cryobacterium sp. Hh7]
MRKLLRLRINFLGAATGVLLLVLWELAVRTGILDFEYLPGPTEIAVGLREITITGELQGNLLHTLTASLTGWGFAAVVGTLFGVVLGLVQPIWRYSMASFEALRALPIVAFVPVAVLLLGFTMQMEITVAFYAAIWPILLSTQAGVRSLDQQLSAVGHVLGLNARERLWKLVLPASTPYIMVGLRLAMSVSLVLTLVAEMVGNPAGLGFALIQKGQSLRPDEMFAYVFVIGMAGIVLNAALVLFARVAFRGQMIAAGETA